MKTFLSLAMFRTSNTMRSYCGSDLQAATASDFVKKSWLRPLGVHSSNFFLFFPPHPAPGVPTGHSASRAPALEVPRRASRFLAAPLIVLEVLILLPLGYAAEPSKGSAENEKVNIEALKQKYFEKSENVDLRVVQNRLYTKSLRFELGPFAGVMSTDPFLNVKEVGGIFGFHFSEVLGLELVAWKNYTKASTALTRLQEDTRRATATNSPLSYLGGELAVSPIYGKLSILGQAIIHYDLHLLVGAGKLKTETGSYTAPIVGIGQEVYLGKYAALRLDYRFMFYTEQFPDGNGKLSPVDSTADVITVGVSLLFGFFD